MTEAPVNPVSQSPPPLSETAIRHPSRWKRATLAGLLSFLFSGTGQLYNRQPRKAFVLAVISAIPGILLIKSRVLFSFWTMLATFLFGIAWKIFVTAEAAYAVAKLKKPEPRPPLPRVTYPLLASIFFVAALIPTAHQIQSGTGFAAFKYPSASMCPTICAGERFVADMHAYSSGSPQRGDLVLIKNPSSSGLLVKQVIAVAGDTVSPGAAGSIFVNGLQFHPPSPCGVATRQSDEARDYITFQSTTVPKGSYFVIGDNLPDSFDSRSPDFGRVSLGTVRGRPVYLYWSSAASRIGCRLH